MQENIADERVVAISQSDIWLKREYILILSLLISFLLYYIPGNSAFGAQHIFHLNPLFSLPFLFVFAFFVWLDVGLALTLLPLSLPFYLLPKPVIGHVVFYPAEIILVICIIAVMIRLLFDKEIQTRCSTVLHSCRRFLLQCGRRDNVTTARKSLFSSGWTFLLPIALFVLIAGVSVLFAYDPHVAERVLREEVFEPILFLCMLLLFASTPRHMKRLLATLFLSSVFVSLIGIVQYFWFRSQIIPDATGLVRVRSVYGSGDDLGLFLDYSLPIGIAYVMSCIRQRVFTRITACTTVLLLPMLLALYLSQSHGAWIALGLGMIILLLLSLSTTRAKVYTGIVVCIVGVISLVLLHHQLGDLLLGHVNEQGISTLSKRLYLWQSAWEMIRARPLTGYGLGNWLCYYSSNALCPNTLHHYMIVTDPRTGVSTGLQYEPTLSHPHNTFLEVWVSIGLFGVLAWLAILVLFTGSWIYMYRAISHRVDLQVLSWILLAIGGAMLAAMIQGLGGSAFFEPDLSFCFWLLIAAMLWLLNQLSVGST